MVCYVFAATSNTFTVEPIASETKYINSHYLVWRWCLVVLEYSGSIRLGVMCIFFYEKGFDSTVDRRVNEVFYKTLYVAIWYEDFRRYLLAFVVTFLLTDLSTLRRQSLGRSSMFTLPSARRPFSNVLRIFPDAKTDCNFFTTKSSTHPAVAAFSNTVNTAASRSSPFGNKFRRAVKISAKVIWFGVASSDSISSLYVLIAMRRASRFSLSSFSQ